MFHRNRCNSMCMLSAMLHTGTELNNSSLFRCVLCCSCSFFIHPFFLSFHPYYQFQNIRNHFGESTELAIRTRYNTYLKNNIGLYVVLFEPQFALVNDVVSFTNHHTHSLLCQFELCALVQGYAQIHI